MAISLGSIVVDLVAKTGGFVEGMTKARQEAASAAKSIKGSFADMGNAAQSLLAPFGEIGAALGQSLGSIGNTMKSVTDSMASLTKELGIVGAGMASVAGAAAALGVAGAGIALFAAKSANGFFEMSEKTGVSVEALTALSYAAKQSGVDSQSLASGLEKMNRAVFAAATASTNTITPFQRMGVAVKDSSGQLRSTQDIIEDLAAKFQTLPNGPAKTALAMQVFGKAGADLLPLMNEGKDGIAAMTKEAQQLGLVLSTQTAEGAHVFEQTLDKIEGALTGASNVILTVTLPAMQGLADFFVNEIKDPSGVFRQLGNTLGDIVVPAFKILASAIAVAVTAGDYFTAALTNGIQFATELVYGLADAFGDLKSGHFKEAGNELKASFQQGLSDFTKGVEDETGKADQRLQNFFAKTFFGANDQSSLPQKKKPTGNVDISPANNEIQNQLSKLKEAAAAQLKLASATDFGTGAIRVQNEQNEIATNLLELSEKAHISLAAATKAWSDAVSKAIVTADEGKALASLNEQITKTVQNLQQHTAETLKTADAIKAGGRAVIDAQAAAAAGPLIEEINQLQTSMANAAKVLGTNSTAYQTLAASLANAKAQLTAFQQAFGADKQADYLKDLATGLDSIRSKIRALSIEGEAIGGTSDQLRQASVAAQLAEYTAAHPGLDTGTAQWKEYADAVERVSQLQQDNADKTNALKYDLSGAFSKALDDLQTYRAELQALGKDTLAVDVAQQNAARNFTKSYDDLLAQTNSVRNGFQLFFDQIALSAKPAAAQIAEVFTNAFQETNDSLVKLIEGQRNALQQLGKSLETSLLKNAVQFTTQKAVTGIGNLFHLGGGKGGSKPDGSTAHNALWVQDVNAAKKLAGALGGKNDSNDSQSTPSSKGSVFSTLTNSFRDIGSKLGDTFKNVFSGLGGIFSKLFSGSGGFGSILSGITGLFGGFRAEGGSVSPGVSYIVGEKGRERFVPTTAGTIVPNTSASEGRSVHVTNHLHIHGVTDADSFRQSKTQILNHMANSVGRAAGRR